MYVGNIFLSFPVHALLLCFVHLLSSRNLSSLILSLSPIFILSFFRTLIPFSFVSLLHPHPSPAPNPIHFSGFLYPSP
ncbi:hypothetical protein BKA57DRAFT_478100 [Linnemannia elongata]|nr:hypothetical protein BKA57DRAFT_478100 [Linnemannia elongata]